MKKKTLTQRSSSVFLSIVTDLSSVLFGMAVFTTQFDLDWYRAFLRLMSATASSRQHAWA